MNGRSELSNRKDTTHTHKTYQIDLNKYWTASCVSAISANLVILVRNLQVCGTIFEGQLNIAKATNKHFCEAFHIMDRKKYVKHFALPAVCDSRQV